MTKLSDISEHDVEAGVHTADGVISGERRDRDVAVSELFHWIYRLFYSKTVGLILILVFAFLSVIGSLVVQVEPAVFADPASRDSFLTEMRGVYGGWTPILSALGFFRLFTSPIFYTVVALLAASIIACTTHRIPELWRRMYAPRLHVNRTFFGKARYRGRVETTASGDEAFDAVTAVLRRHRFRVLVDDKDPAHGRYADRYAWSGLGTVIAHISFVIILLAFVVSSTWGIDEDMQVPVGGTVEVGHGTGLTLHALSFRDSYTADGRPSDYVSELQLRDGDTVVAQQEVRVNQPLNHAGFRFHQASFGIASDVLVSTVAGESVFHDSVPMRWTSNDGANAVGLFEIPDSDFEIVVVTAASGRPDSTVPAGSALIELYRQSESGEPLDVAQATQGSPVTVGGYTVTFERERQYTGIRLRQDPGSVWMWVGSTLLVVGMSITFLLPYRRLWIRVEDTDDGAARQVLLGAVSRFDASYQRMFESVITQVDQELTPPRTETKEDGDG